MPILLAILIAGLGGPAVAASSDGRWSIVVVPETGPCDVLRWQLFLQDGKVLPSANLAAQPEGGVSPLGAVDLRFIRGQHVVIAKGRLDERAGSGTWAAPTKSCSGRWQARRLAAQ